MASFAIADVVEGVPREWAVLGASAHAWWCESRGDVVVLADEQAVQLPNSIAVIGGPARPPVGDPPSVAVIGAGAVAGAGFAWHVVRWWDPAVVAVPRSREVVTSRVRDAERMIPTSRLGSGCTIRAGSACDLVASAGRLMGLGEGLTPEGDDYLLGFLAAYRHTALSLDDDVAGATLDAALPRLLELAARRTTSLSRALLRHAVAGEVTTPLGALLRALTGRGSLANALLATLAIGHTSGAAIAAGAVAGTRAALDTSP